MQLLKISWEAVQQAIHQLMSNKLRTTLSLLGISVGIFCIIAVFASVDSLEENVKGSLETLGKDVVYVSKVPWASMNRSQFWKYSRRPNPSYRDFKQLKDRLQGAQYTAYSIYLGNKTLKYRNQSMKDVAMVAVTDKYSDLFSLEYDKGRFYSYSEYHSGANMVVIGADVAETLFGALDPVGREIKYKGAKLKIIGVIKKKGNEIVSIMNYDDAILLSMPLAARVANLNTKFFFGGGNLMVKAKEGVSVDDMKDEITSVLRSVRHLRPREESNFSLNTMTLLTNMISGIFSAMNIAGFIIGGFAILVGMVSVANIMFVSVKERTNIIGIKKALGAKRWFILLEFLVESVVLSILGGLLGLLFVRIAVIFISKAFKYDIFLSFNNILWGIGISAIVGILAGFIPAFNASRLDPVEAMRR
ncbi:MAG TPA: ABC transporter permease [Saprospiraceae bacterium]|nr:ABC transporter permease [Saprospiraceae bacterium]